MGATPLELSGDVAIVPDLREAYQESRWVTVVLPTGERFLVLPERDVEALHALFSDAGFAASLRQSVAELERGEFEAFDGGETRE